MNVHVPAFSPPSRDALAWLGTRPIPTKPFYDPAWYADEVETIFKRTWIQLGHVCELPRPDSFIVRNLEFAGLIFVLAGRHKRASIRERIEAAGASLRPLPPGSPTSIRSKRPSPASRPYCARSQSARSRACGTTSANCSTSSSPMNAPTASARAHAIQHDRKSLELGILSRKPAPPQRD